MKHGFFLDRGYSDESTFLRQLLKHGDFSLETLKGVARSQRVPLTGRGKDELAADLASRYSLGEIPASSFWEQYLLQERTWLSLLEKDGKWRLQDDLPSKSPEGLLTKLGAPGWYGPVTVEGREFFLWLVRVTTLEKNPDGEIEEIPGRWLVAVEDLGERLALSWDGFSWRYKRSEDADELGSGQYPYWERILELRKSLAPHRDLEIFDLVLLKIWERWRVAEGCSWTDRFALTDVDGVNVRAKGTRFDLGGIKDLCRRLAQTAAAGLGVSATSPQLEGVTEGLLKDMIQHSGTAAYEFILRRPDEPLLQIKAFLGAPEIHGGLKHFRCYRPGMHASAQRFLLEELSQK